MLSMPCAYSCIFITMGGICSECAHFIDEETEVRDLPKVTEQLSLWQSQDFRTGQYMFFANWVPL